ncbi:surface antigen [Plasmodium falciparum UGT5.1]|uniref:Surface antigen n=1 Tax=Plasmodium falciparum UGT5.1 TaxID=1237627 RepID=W7JGF9_PLAFA|nr:surface antigen [Plasmodium falciparum UGT5.1]
MKLHYSKILFFSLLLNILEHNNNKPYITPHTSTTTSRVLSECDLYMPKYDNDADIKSVKENFDRQTSQRFEEYDERMKEKRQKRKEQRDKNIDEIIKKDKMDKSLAEKIEKGCLMCGCGLGGVAASVGIFGTVAVKELTKAAITTATELAKEAVKDGAMAATIKAVGAEAGKKFVIAELQEMGISTVGVQGLQSYFVTTDYTNALTISRAIIKEYQPSSCILPIGGSGPSETFCTWVKVKSDAAVNIVKMNPGKHVSTNDLVEKAVGTIVSDAENVAAAAEQQATKDAIKASTLAVDSKYAICQNAIIASVVALLIIVLIMIIIYLVLRYRRKKKMKKKAEYTKLLNQ